MVWRPQWSYLDGHFIDYLAPKLYLNQLAVWALWALTLWKWWITTRGKTVLAAQFRFQAAKVPQVFMFLGLFGSFSILQSLLWQDWPLFFWTLNFFSGPVLLALWCSCHWAETKRHLLPAVLLATLFQATLAWWQWAHQKSFLGYLFFGEPNLSLPGIVTSSIAGPLLRLPYGTTPHPNILAAWLLWGILCFAIMSKRKKSSISLLLLFPLSFAFWLTESWSAWLSLPLIFLFLWKLPLLARWPIWKHAGVRIGILLLVLIIGILIPSLLAHNKLPVPATETTSLTRRSHLHQVALNQIPSSPGGIGLQKSFQAVKTAETTYLGSRFLQPVHHHGLYIALIHGIWVYFLIFIFIKKEQKYYSFFTLLNLLIIPIFYLDHYFLSTISGQFSLVIFFLLFRIYYNKI